MSFCSKCGAVLDKKERCPKCGIPISGKKLIIGFAVLFALFALVGVVGSVVDLAPLPPGTEERIEQAKLRDAARARAAAKAVKSEGNSVKPETSSFRSTTMSTFVSAEELFGAYKANEVAADLKYKGQRISVSGTVESIGKDILDKPYVTVETGEFGSVRCMFPKSSERMLAGLSIGSRIIVNGKCAGKMMNVLLTDCSW